MSQTHKETLLKMQEPASTDVGSAADYIALMKPRVMSLVVFTALVGLVMAPGAMHPVMAIAAILLIAVGAGASAALNMWYDADIDAVMSRTQDRPVPSGRVTADGALTFGLWVSGLSVLSMAVMINYLSAALLASPWPWTAPGRTRPPSSAAQPRRLLPGAPKVTCKHT